MFSFDITHLTVEEPLLVAEGLELLGDGLALLLGHVLHLRLFEHGLRVPIGVGVVVGLCTKTTN